ncbi:hypothetical protein VU05_00155, partial [Desulfobulbus sp. F1]|nr:hypothetical protein [Desulfobulbus sp. F1]
MEFIDYIYNNKEWLFSGTGVFGIALLATIITSKYSKATDRLIKNQADDVVNFSIIPDDADNLS